MPAFIFKHEEESPIIKLMMNVVILKMVFRGRGRATRGAERRMGAFTPGSPPSAPQAHNIPDLRPRQIPCGERPPALPSSLCILTATCWRPSRGTMSTAKVPHAKGTVPRALTHWPRTGQVALQKPSVWQSPAHWAWSGPLSHQHSPPETADLGGEMHQARLAGGGGGGRL